MRRRLGAGLAAALLATVAAGGCGQRAEDSSRFKLSGTIALVPAFKTRAAGPKRVLLIVAKNSSGIPIAVQRIVSPRFPLAFEMEAGDLVLPRSASQEPLWIEAQVTQRLPLGPPAKGDLVGRYPDKVLSGDKAVYLIINKKL